ncbi:MAG: cytochrome c biogenesis protein ResB [Desulfobacterales bacterium]|nr:cytochrome c biogenesis protein ResB [Desulfobacterales bacterium]
MTKDSSGFLDAVWTLFASLKLTIILLIILAITSIIGTVIPQNATQADYVMAFGEFLYQVFDLLDFFDMYHSWWFQLMLVMLTINITVCSIERLSVTGKTIFKKNPDPNLARFQRLSKKHEFSTGLDSDTIKKKFRSAVKRSLGYIRTGDTDNGFYIYGETGRWTRLGVYVVHTSVVMLLVGGIIGSIFGFDGFVTIPEGEKENRIRLMNNAGFQELEFEIRCDNFEVSFYDTGMAKEFRSSLVIIEDGQETVKKDIIVNDPLRYKGINIFQSSYGSVPSDIAHFSFTNKDSELGYDYKLKVGDTVDLPEAMGTFTLTGFTRDGAFQGHSVGEAFTGTLEKEGEETINLLLPLKFPTFDRMRGGNEVVAVTHFEEKFYTGLQVTKDPGIWVVYTGFLFMIFGCYITFFMSHQRLCVEVIKEKDSHKIIVAGFSDKNKPGMQLKVQKIAERLEKIKD